MRRVPSNPRPHWEAKAAELDYDWHSLNNEPFWDESAYYEFSSAEIDQIEEATNDLYRMIVRACGQVIEGKLLPLLGYDENAIRAIEHSWHSSPEEPSLYGRFDLAFDGKNLKALEFNGDTPTSLFEASVFQWTWLEDLHPEKDQFNSIHDKLVRAFSKIVGRKNSPLYFAHVKPHEEDEGTVRYLASAAMEVGLKTQLIGMHEIGLNEQKPFFRDLQERPIERMFKLYPWEWLLNDCGDKLVEEYVEGSIGLLEPAWKMVASNKMLFTYIWELYPYHPNLLATYAERKDLVNYVRKPVLGREGQNVEIFQGYARSEVSPGNYDDNLFVYQDLFTLPEFESNYPVIGSWVVDGESCGIGVRESTHKITNNFSRFVPHLFLPE